MSSIGGVGGAGGAAGMAVSGVGSSAGVGHSTGRAGGTGSSAGIGTSVELDGAEKAGSVTSVNINNNISSTNINVQMGHEDFHGVKAMGEMGSCSQMDTKKMVELLLMVMLMKMMQELMGDQAGNSLGFSATA